MISSTVDYLCLVAILSLTALGSAVNPGAKIRLSQLGLDYGANVTLDSFVQRANKTKIPDQHGTVHMRFGKVDYDFSAFKITQFTKPQSSISVGPAHGISWSIRNGSFSVHGDWHYIYKWGFIQIRDHGSIDVSVSNISLSIAASLGMDMGGHPTISTKGSSCFIGSVHVHFHGGASWFYNLFKKNIEGALKIILVNSMCTAANEAVNQDAAKALATMKVTVPVTDKLELDYRLLTPPRVQVGFVDIAMKGEVFWSGNRTEAPMKPSPLPNNKDRSRMIYIWLSDYIVNTMGYVLHSHGTFSYHLTRNDLDAKTRDFLNITCQGNVCIGNFISKLAAAFPGCTVELDMESTVAPKVAINPRELTAIFKGNIVYNVRLPNNSLRFAFTTRMSMIGQMFSWLDNSVLKTNVSSFKATTIVTDSAIGRIEAATLDYIFNWLAHSFIIPKLNHVGAKGLELANLHGTSFIKPNLTLYSGCLLFSADIAIKEIN